MSTFTFITALMTLVAYVCRLDALSWLTHKPSVILLHYLLAVLCANALADAAQGRVVTANLVTLGLSVWWILYSYRKWKVVCGELVRIESNVTELQEARALAERRKRQA